MQVCRRAYARGKSRFLERDGTHFQCVQKQVEQQRVIRDMIVPSIQDRELREAYRFIHRDLAARLDALLFSKSQAQSLLILSHYKHVMNPADKDLHPMIKEMHEFCWMKEWNGTIDTKYALVDLNRLPPRYRYPDPCYFVNPNDISPEDLDALPEGKQCIRLFPALIRTSPVKQLLRTRWCII